MFTSTTTWVGHSEESHGWTVGEGFRDPSDLGPTAFEEAEGWEQAWQTDVMTFNKSDSEPPEEQAAARVEVRNDQEQECLEGGVTHHEGVVETIGSPE